MLRLFLDTNVIIGGIRDPEAAPGRLVARAAARNIEVVLCDDLIEEVTRVARREFGSTTSRRARALLVHLPARCFVSGFEWEHLEGQVRFLVLDRGDVPLVCAALEARADAFVTLDAKLSRMPIRAHLRFVRPEVVLSSLDEGSVPR